MIENWELLDEFEPPAFEESVAVGGGHRAKHPPRSRTVSSAVFVDLVIGQKHPWLMDHVMERALIWC